jgi:hypothetical protein
MAGLSSVLTDSLMDRGQDPNEYLCRVQAVTEESPGTNVPVSFDESD